MSAAGLERADLERLNGMDRRLRELSAADLRPVEYGTAVNKRPAERSVFNIGDDADFWESRRSLSEIRDYALACMAAPWGVLGATLVYVLDIVPYSTGLPGIADDDSPGSLNLFVGIAGDSGTGKGSSEKIARRYTGRNVVDVPPGSGEGIAKLFARRPTQKELSAQPGEPEWVQIEQAGADKIVIHQRNAVISVAEIDTLGALMSRSGATLGETLRRAFSGETLGFGYADDSKRIIVPAGAYRMGLIAGIQPKRSAALFDEADGGTPQRFLFFPGSDPRIRRGRENRPAKPKPLTIDTRRWPAIVPMCNQARDDIEIAAEARGQGIGDPLDGHLLFVRAKVAAALSIIDSRREIREDDWHLAGMAIDVSNRVRRHCLDELAAAAAKANEDRGHSEGVRASISEQVKEERAIERIAGRLVSTVIDRGPTSQDVLRNDVLASIFRADGVWGRSTVNAAER